MPHGSNFSDRNILTLDALLRIKYTNRTLTLILGVLTVIFLSTYLINGNLEFVLPAFCSLVIVVLGMFLATFLDKRIERLERVIFQSITLETGRNLRENLNRTLIAPQIEEKSVQEVHEGTSTD